MADTNFTPQEIEQFLQQFFDVVGARQYIGARYIPIFGRAGSDTVEWDDLAPYEPLTVVMHDGVSYVSRRYVPAGADITDTDYWVQTYRFNAQVEQYRQQVLAMQDDVDNRIPFPDPLLYPRFGELGQVLSTLADGTVKWEDPVVPSDEQAEEVISQWLEDHPEATTTVQDRSITPIKLAEGAAFAPPVSYTRFQSEDLDSLLVAGIYTFTYNPSAGSYSASFPVEETGVLIVAKDGSNLIYQVFVGGTTGSIFIRYRIAASGVWRPWQNHFDIEQAAGSFFLPPVSYTPYLNADLDTMMVPGIYVFTITTETPSASFPVEESGVLTITKHQPSNLIYQIYTSGTDGATYIRYYLAGQQRWVEWRNQMTLRFATNFETEIATGRAFVAPVAYTEYITADLDEMMVPGIYTFTYVPETPSATFPVPESGVLTITKHQPSNLIYQIYTSGTDGATYIRYYLVGQQRWVEWRNQMDLRFGTFFDEAYAKKREVSILFVGNSLTQDGIAYLPWLLKTFYPEIGFRFYMYYNGGYDLDEQYAQWTNSGNCDIFSVAENVAAWTNYNSSKSMNDVLTTYEFDIVCMQEYFNDKTTYTDANLSTWNNCRNYIISHYQGNNALKFISLFHAPIRNNATSVFDLTETGNGLILQKTISEDMLANGIAVYRALSTSLDNLGDQGHLSPDGVHTQEGLPCLLQTFVTALWIFDHLGIQKSIYGSPARMTTNIYNTLNVPGPNLGTGVITGTDAENLLAQEVAIKAYKEGKKFVIDNLTEY